MEQRNKSLQQTAEGQFPSSLCPFGFFVMSSLPAWQKSDDRNAFRALL
jgi:hypothetical protein